MFVGQNAQTFKTVFLISYGINLASNQVKRHLDDFRNRIMCNGNDSNV